MKLIQTKQIDFADIPFHDISGVVAASGYECRASQIGGFLEQRPVPAECRKFALGFTSERVGSRLGNDRMFDDWGYVSIETSGDDNAAVLQVMSLIFDGRATGSISLMVDYSCMTRVWYSAILEYLAYAPSPIPEVHVYFVYSIPKFFKATGNVFNSYIGPIPGFCHAQLPDKETALVIGLGHEGQRAMGINEYIDAKKTYLFHTDPASDPHFAVEIKENNMELMERVGEQRCIAYPHNDLRTADVLLSTLCRSLSPNYRIILAPLGPKPFSLLCLLLSVSFMEGGEMIDVWRVSATGVNPPIDRLPSGEMLVYKVVFRES